MEAVDVAVVGAGSAGIAVAYYLVRDHGVRRLALIDALAPMSLTSAQSGENYRNWWPHRVMTAFTDHSIDLMEQLDEASGGRLNMTRGGYALVTRRERPQDLIGELHAGYADSPGQIRVRDTEGDYCAPRRVPWRGMPTGVDVRVDRRLIRQTFPAFPDDVATVIHIRRAGSIDSQQMGSLMLETIREAGGTLLRGKVRSIASGPPFRVEITSPHSTMQLQADRLVNAAGPGLQDLASMLDEDLQVECVFQQKIAFPDNLQGVARAQPFAIDLDGQTLAWSDEDRALLEADPSTRRLTEPMKGGIHCRPDGPVEGNWIKIGWAYNETASDPQVAPPIDPQFPDSVIRAASRLQPRLAAYIGRLPRAMRHYGGFYTQTRENWPLIGPMATPGAFVAGALSGFGSMGACASGSLCAAWVAGQPVPVFAGPLTPERRHDRALMAEL
ncbi:MAG: FAD-binding oxidoreductase, partial [Proteobacteria bacterium]|nr:FAD-binding oxidoreductase [Burkholderiales bacterium]